MLEANLPPPIPGKLTVNRQALLKGHTQPIYELKSNPAKPGYFFSAGADRQVVEWNVVEPETARLKAKATGSVYAIAIDTEGKRLCIGQNFDGIMWLDVARQQTLKSIASKTESIFFIECTQHGWLIGMSSGRVLICSFDLLEIKREMRLSATRLRAVAVGKNFLWIADADGWIYAINASTLEMHYKVQAHPNGVLSLCLNEEGTMLFSGGRDAQLRAWEVGENMLIKAAEVSAHLFSIHALALKPGGRLLATGSMDKTIKIWNPATLELIKVIDQARYGSHSSSVNKLLWLQKPDVLVSCSDDRSIAVWQLLEPTA